MSSPDRPRPKDEPARQRRPTGPGGVRRGPPPRRSGFKRSRALSPLRGPSAAPLIRAPRKDDEATEVRGPLNAEATIDLARAPAGPEDVRRVDEDDPTRIDEVESGSKEPTSRSALPPGAMLGRYRIERLLGRGGMGMVYLARAGDKAYAAKCMNRRLNDDATAVSRFRREVMALARLVHPNVIRLHDFGFAEDHHYFVMDYVSGRDLKVEVDKRGRLPPREAARLIAPCARALQAAHERGIVHRDIKPSNILIDERERPLLTDFGLVRVEGQESLTNVGDIVGTPSYMSPQQANGQRVDAASDIYSLGATLYRAALGRRPYDGINARTILILLLTEPPKAPSLVVKGFPKDLEAIIARAMAREPEARYACAGHLAEDLEAFARGEELRHASPADWKKGGPPGRRLWPAILAALLLAAAGAAAFGPLRARLGPTVAVASATEISTPELDARIGAEVSVGPEERQEAEAQSRELLRRAQDLIAGEGIRRFAVDAEQRSRARGLLTEARDARGDGEPTRAMARVDESLRCDPGFAAARLLRAELFLARGETRRALFELTVIIELASRSRKPDQASLAAALLARAEAFLSFGEGWADHLAERDLAAVAESPGPERWRAKIARIDADIRRARLGKARFGLEMLLPEIEANKLAGDGVLSDDEVARCYFDLAQLRCKLEAPRDEAAAALEEARHFARAPALAAAIGELAGRMSAAGER